MRLWRRIVSVLAGTMIAAGGIIGVLAVSETAAPAPTGVPQGTTQFGNLNEAQARTSIQNDVAVFTDWADATSTRGDPTAEERLTAAVGAQSVMDLAPAHLNASIGSYYAAPPPATGVLSQPQAISVRDNALLIVGGWSTASAPPTRDARYYDTAASSDAPVIATAEVFAFSSSGASALSPADADATTAATTSALDPALHPYLSTEKGITDFATADAPTDLVGLRATAGPSPEPAANWTASAQARINQMVARGALEDDALNLSLASEVLRSSDAATANALNAELRYRQATSGSFGDIRSTAEAARALALGSADDQNAARGAINWLDSQGTLPASDAVWRLRAHTYDGLLVYRPPPAAAGGMPALELASSLSGKGSLAALLLVGGIGLSLSLVTVDALKGSRQRLYDTIRGNPGLHVNELRRRLRMSPSSVEYHLAVLTGAGLVVAEDDGRYKRFYSNGAGLGLNPGAPNSRNTLGALRRPHAVTLLRALLARPQGAAPREISRELGIHESAVSRRLNHLEDAGLLVSERRGRARVFRVRDPGAATKAMTAVEPSPPPLHLTEITPAPQSAESELTAVVTGPAHAQ